MQNQLRRSPAVHKQLADLGYDLIPSAIDACVYFEGNVKLKSAIDNAEVETVKTFLRECPKLFTCHDDDGRSALTYALYRKQEAVAMVMIENNVDVTLPDTELPIWAPIHYAADGNMVGVLLELARNNAINIDTVDVNLCTPLTVAAEKGNTQCVSTLLDCGASQETQIGCLINYPPIYYAAKGKHFETIRCLVERGANIKHRCACGITVEDKLNLARQFPDCQTFFTCHIKNATAILTALYSSNSTLMSSLCNADANVNLCCTHTMNSVKSIKAPMLFHAVYHILCFWKGPFRRGPCCPSHTSNETILSSITNVVTLLNHWADPNALVNGVNPVEYLIAYEIKSCDVKQTRIIENLIYALLNAGSSLKLVNIENACYAIKTRETTRTRRNNFIFIKDIETHTDGMLRGICDYHGRVTPLAGSCRRVIRNSLRDHLAKATGLPLPSRLIDFINLQEYVHLDRDLHTQGFDTVDITLTREASLWSCLVSY